MVSARVRATHRTNFRFEQNCGWEAKWLRDWLATSKSVVACVACSLMSCSTASRWSSVPKLINTAVAVQLVEKRSEELGTLDIAAYESPGVSATSDDSSGGSSSSPSLVVVRELFVDPKRKSTNALLSKVDEADDE